MLMSKGPPGSETPVKRQPPGSAFRYMLYGLLSMVFNDIVSRQGLRDSLDSIDLSKP